MTPDEKDFPGNSRRKRLTGEEPPVKKEIKRVTKGRVFRKKKTFTEKLAQTFLGEDTKNVGAYVLYDVLIPALKTTVQEMFSSGIEMLLFGETRKNSRRKDTGRGYVSYGNFHRSQRSESHDRRPVVSRGRFDFEEVIFEDGEEAADVLDSMITALDTYEQVSVSDFYEFAGVNGGDWSANKWGWTDLSQARCVRVHKGYIIDLPRPIELD